MNRALTALSLGIFATLSACGGDDKKDEGASCDFDAQTGCMDGQACEKLEGDGTKTGCFAPVVVEGRVVRADDVDTGVEGARVVGRDENGAPVSQGIAVTDSDGKYSLRV